MEQVKENQDELQKYGYNRLGVKPPMFERLPYQENAHNNGTPLSSISEGELNVAVQSRNYVEGESGWMLDPLTGETEFN